VTRPLSPTAVRNSCSGKGSWAAAKTACISTSGGPRSKAVKLPVYVWIHGGGNAVGDASTPGYEGRAFAMRHQAIFVSIQYRLGAFGWLAHPALHTGNPDDDSGNFGTLDIIQSLRWIHGNIAAFGGDPGNVTIAGESAGAADVISLLMAPTATGLFHKAVSQSGRKPDTPLADGEKAARALLLQMLVNDGTAADVQGAEEKAAAMQPERIATLPARQVLCRLLCHRGSRRRRLRHGYPA
jgi:para-nitrobenzyl esterase